MYCCYCGSELKHIDRVIFECTFCEMNIPEEEALGSQKRPHKSLRHYISYSDVEITTPELMKKDNYELLRILQFIRKERGSTYSNLKTFKEAAKVGGEEFQKIEQEQGHSYEYWTKKGFVIESILLKRGAYIPKRITEDFFQKQAEHYAKLENKPMQIQKKREGK